MAADLTKDGEEPTKEEVSESTVRELIIKVADLNTTAKRLVPRVEQIEKSKKTFISFFVIVAALMCFIAYAVVGNYITNSRLNDTIRLSLCPVYGLVLGGYNPNTRAEGSDRDEYEKGFQIMRDAYTPLQCEGGLIPGRSEDKQK